MAWVRGIREVRHVQVSVEGPGMAVLRGEHVGLRRGPIITREERVIVDLPAEAIERTVGRRIHFLAEHTGAGPCGVHARRACGRAVFTWSIVHLVDPIAAYYASYVPALHFGAKCGPRGRGT